MRKIAAAAVICLILMLLGGCSISDKIYYGENEHWEIQLTIRSCMNGKGRWDDYRHGQEQMYCAEIVIKPKYPAYKYLQRDAWMASAVIEYDDGRPVTAAFDIPAQAEGVSKEIYFTALQGSESKSYVIVIACTAGGGEKEISTEKIQLE